MSFPFSLVQMQMATRRATRASKECDGEIDSKTASLVVKGAEKENKAKETNRRRKRKANVTDISSAEEMDPRSKHVTSLISSDDEEEPGAFDWKQKIATLCEAASIDRETAASLLADADMNVGIALDR